MSPKAGDCLSIMVEHIAAQTDGVPLFVEELTKTVIESGVSWKTVGEGLLRPPALFLARFRIH